MKKGNKLKEITNKYKVSFVNSKNNLIKNFNKHKNI